MVSGEPILLPDRGRDSANEIAEKSGLQERLRELDEVLEELDKLQQCRP